MSDISNTAEVIAVCNIIERIEELKNDDRRKIELAMLLDVMEQIKDYGCDEKWRGDWYPAQLIRYDHFEEYAQQLAEDIGAVDNNAKRPMNCINWKQAARELKTDYTCIGYDGVDYYCR